MLQTLLTALWLVLSVDMDEQRWRLGKISGRRLGVAVEDQT